MILASLHLMMLLPGLRLQPLLENIPEARFITSLTLLQASTAADPKRECQAHAALRAVRHPWQCRAAFLQHLP